MQGLLCCLRQARSESILSQQGVKLSALQVTVLLDSTRPAEPSLECTHVSTHCAGEGESALLLAGAHHAGFRAGLYVAMPHKGAAKKYFLCMRNEGASVAHSALQGDPSWPQQKCVCPLAWPVSGPLAVQWTA